MAVLVIVVAIVTTAVVVLVVIPAIVVAAESLVSHRGTELFLQDRAILKSMTCILVQRARTVKGSIKFFPVESGRLGRIAFSSVDLWGPFSKLGLWACLGFVVDWLIVVIGRAVLDVLELNFCRLLYVCLSIDN